MLASLFTPQTIRPPTEAIPGSTPVSERLGVGAAPSEMRIDSFTESGSRKTIEN